MSSATTKPSLASWLKASASEYRFSESNHRQFYQRWAQLMAAEKWAEIKS